VFNYLPKKFQNLVSVLVLTSCVINILVNLQDDVVYALVGDDRSDLVNPDGYGLYRYVFLLIVVAACALTLRKNAKNGEDSLV
jgi:hypothetical protein